MRSCGCKKPAAAAVGVLAVTVFNPIVATTKRVYEQRVAGLSGQDGGALLGGARVAEHQKQVAAAV